MVLDSLRADFLELCNSQGEHLPHAFRALRSLTSPCRHSTCGSIGSLPMRTDLLTGRLAFLDERWAGPTSADSVWTQLVSAKGVHTTLVTDNYVLFLPDKHLGFHTFFDDCHFIRGAGSDRHALTKPRWRSTGRTAQAKMLEEQSIANLEGWRTSGSAPHARLFEAAENTLRNEVRNGRDFLLWVDSFSPHEPWIEPEDLEADLPSVPILPESGLATSYLPQELEELKRRYARRIATLDFSMASFVAALAPLVRAGDVGLALISDHGYLFGEYGLVGKPKDHPPTPPLYDVVTWTSPHFSSLYDSPEGVQPHTLGRILAAAVANLGDYHPTSMPACPGWHVVGRNGPTVHHLALVAEKQQAVLFRDDAYEPIRWYDRSQLDARIPWSDQPYRSSKSPNCDWAGLLPNRPWIANFQKSLNPVLN